MDQVQHQQFEQPIESQKESLQEDGVADVLRWMSGHTLTNIRQREDIKNGLGVENIEDNKKNNRLKC